MPQAHTSTLLGWFADHEPGRTHRAGALVFVDLDLARSVIDRAEAAGIAIRRARGFAVIDGLAQPVAGQVVEPSADGLLDCETPSGASCGTVRRTIRGSWAAQPPKAGRHMVLFDIDDEFTEPAND